MQQPTLITVHESESPEANSLLLREGLRQKNLPQKFLYNTYGQAGRWLALHKAWSPAQRDTSTIDLYSLAALAAVQKVNTPVVHVVGLACGSAEKEGRVVTALRAAGKTPVFTPLDTSLGLVLGAAENMGEKARGTQCHPVLADLSNCSTLPALLRVAEPVSSERVVCLFGVLHTFEPHQLLPRILNAVRSQDQLLLSVNMAPAQEYQQAMRRILPQYDNPETRRWLEGALLQLGFESGDVKITFQIEEGTDGLSRFAACAIFQRGRSIEIEGERFTFAPNDRLNLFISYRYTVPFLQNLLGANDLQIVDQWTSASQEEGVFLCRRAPRKNP